MRPFGLDCFSTLNFRQGVEFCVHFCFCVKPVIAVSASSSYSIILLCEPTDWFLCDLDTAIWLLLFPTYIINFIFVCSLLLLLAPHLFYSLLKLLCFFLFVLFALFYCQLLISTLVFMLPVFISPLLFICYYYFIIISVVA